MGQGQGHLLIHLTSYKSSRKTYQANSGLQFKHGTPQGTPTLQHMVTKKYSRPDNLFCTENIITQCEVTPLLCPTATNHFPIVTKISLPQEQTNTPPSFNFREANWIIIWRELCAKLNILLNPTSLNNKYQLNTAENQLTTALQEMIQENIQKTKWGPDAKRWWNSDLNWIKR